MAAEPINWWQRDGKSWNELDSLPSSAAFVVFANADRSKTWLAENPDGPVDSSDGDEAAYWGEA